MPSSLLLWLRWLLLFLISSLLLSLLSLSYYCYYFIVVVVSLMMLIFFSSSSALSFSLYLSFLLKRNKAFMRSLIVSFHVKRETSTRLLIIMCVLAGTCLDASKNGIPLLILCFNLHIPKNYEYYFIFIYLCSYHTVSLYLSFYCTSMIKAYI